MKGWDALERSPSRLLAMGCVSFVVGIAVAPLFLWAPGLVFLFIALTCGAFFWLHRGRPGKYLFLFACLFFLGLWRYALSEWPKSQATIADVDQGAVRVSGVVTQIEPRFSGARGVLSGVTVADEPRQGRLLVWLPEHTGVHLGNELVFACRLRKPAPIESFRYDRHLRAQGIGSVCGYPEHMDVRIPERRSWHLDMMAWIGQGKDFLFGRLAAIAPEPHASFLSGLLFGGGSLLPSDVRDDFSRTGTSHILAASGFNVALFTLWFLGWAAGTCLKRRGAILATGILLVVYTFAAGATPAVARAAVMAGLLLVARFAWRRPYTLNLLLITASCLLLFNPRLLLNDVGFQLSFVAVAAILFAGRAWGTWLAFLPERYGIRESFASSAAAIVFTLPITLWHFGTISILSPFTNILVLPLIPFLMGSALTALAASFLSIHLGLVVALVPVAVSTLVLDVIQWQGAIPFASVPVMVSRFVAVAVAAGIFYVWWYVAHIKK